MTLLQSHYLLCPPFACNTARTHLGIDSINRRIRSCGILPHSCSRACCSSCRVCSVGWRLRTRRSKSSHKCSIGFKSGDLRGQGSTVTFCSTCCVPPSVVALKNFPTEVHCGQHVWCQKLISVSSGDKVAGDVHQLSF